MVRPLAELGTLSFTFAFLPLPSALRAGGKHPHTTRYPTQKIVHVDGEGQEASSRRPACSLWQRCCITNCQMFAKSDRRNGLTMYESAP